MAAPSSSARLPSMEYEELSEAQKDFHAYLSRSFDNTWGKNFKIKDDDGRFVGPFGIMISTPSIGTQFFELAKALSDIPGLPAQARETAILAVGAHFQANYELYAHDHLAAKAGLQSSEIASLGQGKLLDTSNVEKVVAFDVAAYLLKQAGPLRPDLWERAVETFGRSGAIALVHFVGFYAYTCVILNGFDAVVPVQ